jgi:hypothetical protein
MLRTDFLLHFAYGFTYIVAGIISLHAVQSFKKKCCMNMRKSFDFSEENVMHVRLEHEQPI